MDRVSTRFISKPRLYEFNKNLRERVQTRCNMRRVDRRLETISKRVWTQFFYRTCLNAIRFPSAFVRVYFLCIGREFTPKIAALEELTAWSKSSVYIYFIHLNFMRLFNKECVNDVKLDKNSIKDTANNPYFSKVCMNNNETIL